MIYLLTNVLTPKVWHNVIIQKIHVLFHYQSTFDINSRLKHASDVTALELIQERSMVSKTSKDLDTTK